MDHYLSHPESRLVPALQDMAGLSADVHFNLRTASMERLLEALRNSEVQVAIGAFAQFDQEMEYYELHREQQILCCSTGHALARQGVVPNRAQVTRAGYALALYGYGQDSALLDNCVATVHQIEGMVAFILSGRGLGYLPDHVAHPFLESQRMANVLPDVFSSSLPIYLAVRRKSLESPLVERFVQLLQGLHGLE
jgi:DNA-binding transcriptional LysR family regulator